MTIEARARVVARRWFSRIARYQEEFLDAVDGRDFRNPETGNHVEFGSLPAEEQARVYESWSRSKKREKDDDSGGQKRDDDGDEKDLASARLAPNPDRYERLVYNIDEDTKKFVHEVLGGEHSRDRLLDAVGIRSIGHLIEDVEVTTETRDDGGVDLSVRGFGDHGIEFKRILSYDKVGDTHRPSTIRNESFMVDQSAPEGIGTRMLATQVMAASAEGFREISTLAFGGPKSTWQGYYVWPRLGFDGEIDPDVLAKVPDDLRADLEELSGGEPPRLMHMMASSEGRSWWRDNGQSTEAVFPLGGQDNISRDVLTEYVREKAKKSGKKLGEFLDKVGSSKTPSSKQKGDNLRLSKDDDKILDSVWDQVRKRLLAKKSGHPGGSSKPHERPRRT